MNLGAQRTTDNALIVYDIARQAYMIRRGFEISHLCSHDGAHYLINGQRIVYRLEEGADYDAVPLDAYWTNSQGRPFPVVTEGGAPIPELV